MRHRLRPVRKAGLPRNLLVSRRGLRYKQGMEPSLSYSYSQSAVSAAVVDQLRRTRGWVLFFGVMFWIGTVFLCLGGLAMIGMGLFSGAIAASGEQTLDSLGAGIGAATFVGMGVLYLVLAMLYIYPATRLTKYASRIRDLMNAPAEQNLVAALNEQRAFWKFVGVMTISMMALYIVGIVVMVVVGVAGAAAAAGGAAGA